MPVMPVLTNRTPSVGPYWNGSDRPSVSGPEKMASGWTITLAIGEIRLKAGGRLGAGDAHRG